MQMLRKEQKSKIECKLQILIMFQLFTCAENPLFKLGFIMTEKEFQSQHRQVRDQPRTTCIVSS